MLLYPANYQDGTLFGTARAFQSLDDGYRNFSHTLVRGVGQVQDMMGKVMHDLGQDLSSARSQVNELVGAVLERRVEEVETQARLDESTHQVDQRTALARDAIHQIGDAAKAFLLSKGLSSESAELVGTLSSHPGLMAALQEPEVQALLSDPKNLDVLARSLRQVGRQHQAMQAGEQSTAASATEPGPPSNPGPAQTGQLPATSPWASSPTLPAGSQPSGQRAVVTMSPGLAARAAQRALYNNSVSGAQTMPAQPALNPGQWPTAPASPTQGFHPGAWPNGMPGHPYSAHQAQRSPQQSYPGHPHPAQGQPQPQPAHPGSARDFLPRAPAPSQPGIPPGASSSDPAGSANPHPPPDVSGDASPGAPSEGRPPHSAGSWGTPPAPASAAPMGTSGDRATDGGPATSTGRLVKTTSTNAPRDRDNRLPSSADASSQAEAGSRTHGWQRLQKP